MHTVIKMMYRRWLFRKVAESKYRRESRRKEKQQHASVSVSVRAGGFYKTSPQTKLMHYIETHFIHIYIYTPSAEFSETLFREMENCSQ